LLPFLAENDPERRLIHEAAGPFWDGNEVWLVTAGGVTFAAFPKAYAILFSALYAPLLILLYALIFRAVSFEFRDKIDSPRWRSVWDGFQFLGSFLPALLLGVAFANLFKGIAIDESGVHHGNILSLLNLYGLAGGFFFVIVFAFHGSLWLAIRADGPMHEKARKTAVRLWRILIAATAVFLALTWTHTPLYENYFKMPTLCLIPLSALAALFSQAAFLKRENPVPAFAANAVFIVCMTLFGIFGMYPALIPSSLSAAANVTTASAASTPMTLTIMLAVTLVCIPVVIGYQAWVYLLFSHKIAPSAKS
jgi:cytochrome d ubiquinol oxidase subunit II